MYINIHSHSSGDKKEEEKKSNSHRRTHDHTHPFRPNQTERGWQTFLTAIATQTREIINHQQLTHTNITHAHLHTPLQQ